MYHSALTLPAELSMPGSMILCLVSSTAVMASPATPTARLTSAARSGFIYVPRPKTAVPLTCNFTILRVLGAAKPRVQTAPAISSKRAV